MATWKWRPGGLETLRSKGGNERAYGYGSCVLQTVLFFIFGVLWAKDVLF